MRRVALARAALVLAGLGVLLVIGWGDAPWWGLLAIAVLSGVSYRLAGRIRVGQQGFGFALDDAVIAVAFVFTLSGSIAVATSLGFVAMIGKRPWQKVSYNAAAQFFSVAVGVLVAISVGGALIGACVGTVVFCLVNHLVVAIPMALTSHLKYWRLLADTGPMVLVQTAGNASVGILAGWLALTAPVGLLGLVVPVGLLWWSYLQQSRRAAEARLFAELARGQERLGGSVDASAQVVLAAAGQLFGAPSVEMVLRHPDGVLRYRGDGSGATQRERVDADAFDAPWVLRALASRGVIMGHDAGRPYCSIVLGDPSGPLAVLVAHRAERAAPFTRDDVQLAQVLAAQAESWLSVAELSAAHDEAVGRAEAYGAASRVLGDLGAETVPALTVLRESAHRLSRLASGYQGPDAVSEIVAELYSVERAVASLLGAISLASTATPVLTTGDAPASGGDAEWTTTGRLEDAVGP